MSYKDHVGVGGKTSSLKVAHRYLQIIDTLLLTFVSHDPTNLQVSHSHSGFNSPGFHMVKHCVVIC